MRYLRQTDVRRFERVAGGRGRGGCGGRLEEHSGGRRHATGGHVSVVRRLRLVARTLRRADPVTVVMVMMVTLAGRAQSVHQLVAGRARGFAAGAVAAGMVVMVVIVAAAATAAAAVMMAATSAAAVVSAAAAAAATAVVMRRWWRRLRWRRLDVRGCGGRRGGRIDVQRYALGVGQSADLQRTE